MNPEEGSTYSVIVTGIKGVGKRSLINAITENKRTSSNVPVMSFAHPQTEKEYNLFFMPNNLIAKGIHGTENRSKDKPRWEDEDKSMESYCFGEVSNHQGLNIYMYDISNSQSFLCLQEQINRSKIMNHGFTYLIGNKVDKQMENRQVEFEEAKNFADECGMAFSEISVVTKKNLTMVIKMIKNGVFQFLKGEKEAPQLPPRDSEFDKIDESLYSATNGSDYEKRLVERMYSNNKNSEEISNSELDHYNLPSQESKKLRTGNFGDNGDSFQEDGRSNPGSDYYNIHDFQQEFHFPLENNIKINQSKSTANIGITPRRNSSGFSKKGRFTPDDFHKRDDVDNYNHFIKQFKLINEEQDRSTHPESKGTAQSYSNLIEKRKLDNNISFSNNAPEIHEDSPSQELHDLEDLDLDYDAYAQKEFEQEEQEEQDIDQVEYQAPSEDVSQEDRVRQPPASYFQKSEIYTPPHLHDNSSLDNIDQEIKKIEDSIKEADQNNNSIAKRRMQFSQQKGRSRNRGVDSSAHTISDINTHRDQHYNYSKSFLDAEEDFSSKSLIDIRTESRQANLRKSQERGFKSKGNMSSRAKKSPISLTKVYKPVIEGEILLKITVKLKEDSIQVLNVYKGDTAFSIADRCISQYLNKMKTTLTVKNKTIIELKKKLATYIQNEINSSIQHLKEEVEKEEQRALKENLKKMELKKKQALDKKKPFDLKTEKRPQEKEILKKEHPIIGQVKVMLGPTRTGNIAVREGCDPEKVAENFMHSYSVPQKHKETIIARISQVISQKAKLDSQKKVYHAAEMEEDSNNLQSASEESEAINGNNFFNIPDQNHEFSESPNVPTRFGEINRNETENENPNTQMMSPHFRGQDLYVQQPVYQNNINYAKTPQLQLDEKIEFEGFSPKSSETLSRRGSLAHHSNGKLIDSSKSKKRSSSKQKRTGNLLYKVRLNFDGQSSIVVKVKEGDNLYSKAAEIVQMHNLDKSLIMKISELLSKPSALER
ncbi:unnamed protein product [Moneuplotes crassus]|uniref:Uncharacterized protein n=1 Tax=Euplotes crassus TaxID=5936 RepID=A0AAD2D2V4_EUPCR|nr:unnamed protein product [Moneuplotes crassus]